MTKHGIIKERMIRILLDQPNTWFDVNSMALTINAKHFTVNRIKKYLISKSLIDVKGSYFKCCTKGFIYG